MYCEYSNHTVKFTLKNSEQIVSRSIRESFSVYTAPFVEGHKFIKCHSAFVVNMRYVKSFQKDSFTMADATEIPISKGQYTMVRDLYMDYIMQ